MPRWRDLPEELDPQVREFASQLRRLVDRSGLSIAAVADRTGYSKTSWERYLNGRLLAPKGAIVALSEVTGTNPVHLTTMWELAERAWSRSEMRHDMTMEAIRISQARAALGEFGAPPANAKSGRGARRSGSATATPGVAGPAGVAPTVPPRAPVNPMRDAAEEEAAASSSAASPSGSDGVNSWGLAGYRGPSPSGGGTGATGGTGPATPPAASYAGPPQGHGRSSPPAGSGNGKRRLTMFLVGMVGVLVVVAGVFWLMNPGDGKKNEGATPTPTPTATKQTDLPPGVECSGASCTGKDAEAMGCSGDLVTTAQTAKVGTAVVEVRYSETCGAAWGRVTQGTQGDKVTVKAGKNEESGAITAANDTIAYTPMVAVKDAGDATACVTLAAGQEGCTQ
ncbi:Helix-turn-helix domain-containing protein [Streptomyces sp. DI166]|uniref:XRE family transcriptional regulator n=1 Tax=Streptomyces sp. DI166 TaxID=1839783 RepID=UPI0007F534EA|nr:XRE family transcriptional regulator [Streptomyces sp. DI166]SBT91911.1 Helix-turn-helix domain-containing protein [Streptomyces sp. DI166]